MKKKPKKQYYVCDKKTGGTWFSCDTHIEAKEWINIAPFKAGEPKHKFYIRKSKVRSKDRRFYLDDVINSNYDMGIN